MECGPLNETMRGPLGPLFTETQYVMDVYGAGMYYITSHYIMTTDDVPMNNSQMTPFILLLQRYRLFDVRHSSSNNNFYYFILSKLKVTILLMVITSMGLNIEQNLRKVSVRVSNIVTVYKHSLCYTHSEVVPAAVWERILLVC